MTQAQLGEACSLSTAHIGHIERGTRTLSVDALVQVSDALGVSVDYLLTGVVPEDIQPISYLQSAVRNASPDKAKTFLRVVRALADKIDDL